MREDDCCNVGARVTPIRYLLPKIILTPNLGSLMCKMNTHPSLTMSLLMD
ncbi:hypothetical protein V6Z11_D03G129800 [Gossypium hirsutum]